MNIYKEKIEHDMPILIDLIKNANDTSVFHDVEREILENFLDERNIKASAELVEKINEELEKEIPTLPFIYVKAYAQYEEQLGRVLEENETDENEPEYM